MIGILNHGPQIWILGNGMTWAMNHGQRGDLDQGSCVTGWLGPWIMSNGVTWTLNYEQRGDLDLESWVTGWPGPWIMGNGVTWTNGIEPTYPTETITSWALVARDAFLWQPVPWRNSCNNPLTASNFAVTMCLINMWILLTFDEIYQNLDHAVTADFRLITVGELADVFGADARRKFLFLLFRRFRWSHLALDAIRWWSGSRWSVRGRSGEQTLNIALTI